MTAPIKVCAVLTAYNRRGKTLTALRAFFNQREDLYLSAVLMDDGSTDGTAEAVQAAFHEVVVMKGNGAMFWNRGMALAFIEACSRGADYYLWLNDDTILYPDALSDLLEDASSIRNPRGCIIVGSSRDPESGVCTYGGVRSISKWHAGKFARIQPCAELQSCDAMNGNVVLISADAAQTTGEIDPYFSHSLGDYDYGLRAVRNGVSVMIGSGFHGECPRNPFGSIWYESRTMRERYERVNSPKGLPMKEWAYFLKKHGNMVWPLAWLATYRHIITG
jgi:GT2 family glycosyltransferase